MSEYLCQPDLHEISHAIRAALPDGTSVTLIAVVIEPEGIPRCRVVSDLDYCAIPTLVDAIACNLPLPEGSPIQIGEQAA